MLNCYISCYALPHTMTQSINIGFTNLTERSPVVPSSFPCAGFLSRATWWPDLRGLLSCERITVCVWYGMLACFSKHTWHLLESTWLYNFNGHALKKTLWNECLLPPLCLEIRWSLGFSWRSLLWSVLEWQVFCAPCTARSLTPSSSQLRRPAEFELRMNIKV